MKASPYKACRELPFFPGGDLADQREIIALRMPSRSVFLQAETALCGNLHIPERIRDAAGRNGLEAMALDGLPVFRPALFVVPAFGRLYHIMYVYVKKVY